MNDTGLAAKHKKLVFSTSTMEMAVEKCSRSKFYLGHPKCKTFLHIHKCIYFQCYLLKDQIIPLCVKEGSLTKGCFLFYWLSLSFFFWVTILWQVQVYQKIKASIKYTYHPYYSSFCSRPHFLPQLLADFQLQFCGPVYC